MSTILFFTVITVSTTQFVVFDVVLKFLPPMTLPAIELVGASSVFIELDIFRFIPSGAVYRFKFVVKG